MEAFATAGIAGAFGRGFLTEAVRDSYQLLKNTATYQYPLIQSTLLEIDLKSYLKTVEIILLEIEIDSETPAAIKYCYEEILNSIKSIKTELLYIQNTIESHPKKWASYLRRPDYKKNLRRLKLYKLNCDRRLDLLMKSIELHSRPSRAVRTPSPLEERMTRTTTITTTPTTTPFEHLQEESIQLEDSEGDSTSDSLVSPDSDNDDSDKENDNDTYNDKYNDDDSDNYVEGDLNDWQELSKLADFSLMSNSLDIKATKNYDVAIPMSELSKSIV